MTYRDDSGALRQRIDELVSEVDTLRARVAELESERAAGDNSGAVLRRQIDVLREENERLRRDIKRLDPNHTTEDREKQEDDEKAAKFIKGITGTLDALTRKDRY